MHIFSWEKYIYNEQCSFYFGQCGHDHGQIYSESELLCRIDNICCTCTCFSLQYVLVFGAKITQDITLKICSIGGNLNTAKTLQNSTLKNLKKTTLNVYKIKIMFCVILRIFNELRLSAPNLEKKIRTMLYLPVSHCVLLDIRIYYIPTYFIHEFRYFFCIALSNASKSTEQTVLEQCFNQLIA